MRQEQYFHCSIRFCIFSKLPQNCPNLPWNCKLNCVVLRRESEMILRLDTFVCRLKVYVIRQDQSQPSFCPSGLFASIIPQKTSWREIFDESLRFTNGKNKLQTPKIQWKTWTIIQTFQIKIFKILYVLPNSRTESETTTGHVSFG